MKTTNYILQPGLHPPTQAYHVFDRSRNQYILNCLHLVPLFTGASVLYCGRAMQVGIIGGAALGTGWLCLLALSGLGRRRARFRWFLPWSWCALGFWLLVF